MPYDSMNDMLEMIDNSGKEKYKCTNCGIINESDGEAPSHCVKCENTKFYKIK